MIPHSLTRALETRINELLKANTDYLEEAREARRATLKAEAVAEVALDALAAAQAGNASANVVITNRSRAEEDFEGQRGLQVRKYGRAHDDKLTQGELARAAAVYVLDHVDGIDAIVKADFVASLEPWPSENLPRRQALLVAANLLLCEVERMDRRERRDARIEAEKSVKAELASLDDHCNEKRRIVGLAMPRTCALCGQGPCPERRKAAIHG